MRRPTRPARLRNPAFQPPLTFAEAWRLAEDHPQRVFRTQRGTMFRLQPGITGRGPRRGARVIRFMRPDGESSRAYEECWGCVTNVNRTYIDTYTAAIR